MIRKYYLLVSVGIVFALHGTETVLSLKNEAGLPLKIELIKKILISPLSINDKKLFLGAYPTVERSAPAVPFDWITRDGTWERFIYRVTPQKLSPGFPLDILFECGSGWSFLLAKSGGSWENLLTQQPAQVIGTDLWIKAGATLLTPDKPDREKMQIGPHITCNVTSFLEGLSQNYRLTFAKDGDQEVFVRRLLEPGFQTILLENQTTTDWRVTIDGLSAEKKYLHLIPNTIEKAFSFSLNAKGRAFAKSDILLSFVPTASSKKRSFCVVFKRLATDTDPTVLVGPTPYRLSTSFFVPGIFIYSIKKNNEWRFVLTLDAAIELKEKLITAIREYRGGGLDLTELKKRIDALLAQAPEKLKFSPVKMSLEKFRSQILNVPDDQDMTPVLSLSNNIDMIDFLAARGADLAVQDNQLLFLAIKSQNKALVDYLLNRNILPGLRHIAAARVISPQIAKLLIVRLLKGPLTASLFDSLEQIVNEAKNAGDSNFAVWTVYHIRNALQGSSPELIMRSNALVDQVTLLCAQKAVVEVQNQRSEGQFSIKCLQSLKSEIIPYQGTTGYTTVDAICKDSDSTVEQDYTLSFYDLPLVTMRCLFTSDEQLLVQLSDKNGTVIQSGTDVRHTLEVGGKDIRITGLAMKEGGQSKFKWYIEPIACSQNAIIELINERPELGFWATPLLQDGQRGITTGLNTSGSRQIETICQPLSGNGYRERIYEINASRTKIGSVFCRIAADGSLKAQIRAEDTTTVLKDSLRDGWTVAGGIGKGIREHFAVPGGDVSLTVEAVKIGGQSIFKIYLQAAGLPLQ